MFPPEYLKGLKFSATAKVQKSYVGLEDLETGNRVKLLETKIYKERSNIRCMNKITRDTALVAVLIVGITFILQLFNLNWIESVFGKGTMVTKVIYLVLAICCGILSYDAYIRSRK